jgi:hypothetical protein
MLNVSFLFPVYVSKLVLKILGMTNPNLLSTYIFYLLLET